MKDIVWSDDALHEFDVAIAHIARENARNANLVADRIESAVDRLAELPTGHPGRVSGTYEKVVLRTSYILAYALSDQAVTILHVIHGHREWLDEAWPTED